MALYSELSGNMEHRIPVKSLNMIYTKWLFRRFNYAVY